MIWRPTPKRSKKSNFGSWLKIKILIESDEVCVKCIDIFCSTLARIVLTATIKGGNMEDNVVKSTADVLKTTKTLGKKVKNRKGSGISDEEKLKSPPLTDIQRVKNGLPGGGVWFLGNFLRWRL